MQPIRPIDPVITFKNSQGESARGTLTSLQRRSLVMEIYNPYSIVQSSEVLTDLTISTGSQRNIYKGKAVVVSLLNTGLMAVVSLTLIDEWNELNSMHHDLKQIKVEAQTFVREWNARFKIDRNYQVVVSELRSFLSETARWVDQIELSNFLPRTTDGRLREDVFFDLAMPVIERGKEYFYQFESEANHIFENDAALHRSFAQQNLHPLLMRSPFVHRTYTKPLGYAGDYEMVNQIINEPRQGPSAYFQIINTVFLNNAVSQAHRNRIDILVDKLSELTKSLVGSKKINILNIACGPALEVQRLLSSVDNVDNLSFTLLDFSDVTLAHTKSKIQEIINAKKLNTEINYVQESVHDLLKRNAKKTIDAASLDKYDFIYCAGLFDYLTDKVCIRLLEYFSNQIKPNCNILITNVHSDNPEKNIMEHILEWHLIYRNENTILNILPKNSNDIKIYKDKTGINIFLEYSITK